VPILHLKLAEFAFEGTLGQRRVVIFFVCRCRVYFLLTHLLTYLYRSCRVCCVLYSCGKLGISESALQQSTARLNLRAGRCNPFKFAKLLHEITESQFTSNAIYIGTTRYHIYPIASVT